VAVKFPKYHGVSFPELRDSVNYAAGISLPIIPFPTAPQSFLELLLHPQRCRLPVQLRHDLI
jgi:hypothetical protein